MKILNVIPCFNCSCNCVYCFMREHSQEYNLLSLDILEKVLKENVYDKVVISGGESIHKNKEYMNNLVNLIKKYNKVYINSRPLTKNVIDDVHYELSYAFSSSKTSAQVWSNLVSFPKEFTLKVLLEPATMTLHPNIIYKKLLLLKNLKEVEFVPFYKNASSKFIIKRNVMDNYMKLILNSGLKLPFEVTNKKIVKDILNGKEYQPNEEYYLYPTGEIKVPIFDDDKIVFSKDLEADRTIPDYYNLYNIDVINWAKTKLI